MVVAAAGYAALQLLGRTWGTTPPERTMAFPGDDVVSAVAWQTTHAITIDGEPEDVWPWLVQMGYDHGGW